MHSRRRYACPLGFISALAMIGAVQCVFGLRHEVRSPSGRVEMSWQAASRAARGPEGNSEVLCFGDSRIKLGILPRVLHARIRVSAYNLGMLGGQAPSTYFLLRQVLERGNRPRAILVDFSESLLTFAPSGNVACWAGWIGPREGLDLAWQSKDPALAVSTALHSLLPGWCDHGDRSPLVGAGANEGICAGPEDDSRVFERNWRLNHGAQAAPRGFVQVEETDGRGVWRIHPTNAVYVDRFLRTAQGGGIAVYWILPPSVAARREQRERTGSIAAYRRFLAERVTRFSCLTVLDGERLPWSDHSFRDPLHLNRDGAVRLSLAVAAAVEPRLLGPSAGPRWVELIASHNPDLNKYRDMLEDLDQSRAAIKPILVGQSFGEANAW